MAMIVADTDVLIDFLTGSQPSQAQVTACLAQGQLATTAVTRFELLAGVRSAKQTKSVGELLDALTTLPLDGAAADDAASIRRHLEGAGRSIGMADSLIAGIVRSRGGVLLTRNRKHFDRVSDLTLHPETGGVREVLVS